MDINKNRKLENRKYITQIIFDIYTIYIFIANLEDHDKIKERFPHFCKYKMKKKTYFTNLNKFTPQ